MNATEIIELVARIFAMLLAAACVVGMVMVIAQALNTSIRKMLRKQ